ncbi:MAG: ABC transporter ATP-binding protein [Phycisphaerales bacterium JB059]
MTSTHAQPQPGAAPPTPGALLSLRDLRKTYRLGRVKVPVLHGVDLDIAPAESVAILGASGSGKSTLLHLAGGLDRPDKANPRAQIVFNGRDLARSGRAELDRYRARDVGFVFQFYHLLPELSVLQNVTVGAMIRHGLGYAGNRAEAVAHARELLEAFGLGHRLRHRPNELSGGERQRVAIARALINRPRLLLADEPTGNLDAETGGQILNVIADLREKFGLTMLMVTHDLSVAQRADRVVRLGDGLIQEG